MVRALLQSLIKQTESHIKYDDPQERRFSKDEILNRQAAGQTCPCHNKRKQSRRRDRKQENRQKSTQESCRKTRCHERKHQKVKYKR